MDSTKTLAARLRERATNFLGEVYTFKDRGLDEEAADYLERLSAPDVGVGLKRYTPWGHPGGDAAMIVSRSGEWVRFEDVAPLLAARAVPAPGPLQPKCQHCNDTGLVAINATTGIYARPGPVPHDARGYAEAPCWECNAYPGGFDGPTGAD